MKKLLLILFILLLSLVVLFIINIGVERQEKMECLKWKEEALMFPDYYLENWQIDQCDPYQIKIDASVKPLPRM